MEPTELINQGGLALAFALIFWVYRKDRQDAQSAIEAAKASVEQDREILIEVVRDNTKSNTQLVATNQHMVSVINHLVGVIQALGTNLNLDVVLPKKPM